MNMRRRAVVIRAMTVFMAGALLSAWGCGAVQKSRAPQETAGQEIRGPIRAGITPTYPPVIFLENGKVSGIEADLAEALSAELKTPVVFVEKPFPELISSLVRGEIDMIMSGMSVTAKREALVRFVRPYMHVGQMAIIRKEDRQRFAQPKEAIYVNGLRVGYQSGTTGMAFAVEKLLLAELVKFDSAEFGLTALRDGGIEVFIHDSPTAWRIPANAAYSDLMALTAPLTREPLAWAVRKDDKALADRLNAVLDAWKKNGRLDAIIGRWVPVSLQMK
ncbi:MAG: substrate-binding periplasmic protein [Thermodesulfobacteriota bacterium]